MNKKENRYSICGDIAKVRMSNADVDMLCDAADWEKAKGHTWSLSATGYAVSNIGGKPVPFHRFLFPGHAGDIDHINGKSWRILERIYVRCHTSRTCSTPNSQAQIRAAQREFTGIKKRRNGRPQLKSVGEAFTSAFLRVLMMRSGPENRPKKNTSENMQGRCNPCLSESKRR